MEKREKAEFLLEQIRLCFLQRDFVRMLIISNKVSKKVLDEAGFEVRTSACRARAACGCQPHCVPLVLPQDLKLRFYRLMIELHAHNKDTNALYKDYQAIYSIKTVLEDRALWSDTLGCIVVFLALSPFEAEVSDLLHRFKSDKRLADLPAYQCVCCVQAPRFGMRVCSRRCLLNGVCSPLQEARVVLDDEGDHPMAHARGRSLPRPPCARQRGMVQAVPQAHRAARACPPHTHTQRALPVSL